MIVAIAGNGWVTSPGRDAGIPIEFASGSDALTRGLFANPHSDEPNRIGQRTADAPRTESKHVVIDQAAQGCAKCWAGRHRVSAQIAREATVAYSDRLSTDQGRSRGS